MTESERSQATVIVISSASDECHFERQREILNPIGKISPFGRNDRKREILHPFGRNDISGYFHLVR